MFLSRVMRIGLFGLIGFSKNISRKPKIVSVSLKATENYETNQQINARCIFFSANSAFFPCKHIHSSFLKIFPNSILCATQKIYWLINLKVQLSFIFCLCLLNWIFLRYILNRIRLTFTSHKHTFQRLRNETAFRGDVSWAVR